MAGEGYIPYGLDRSSKWADDISRARKAQQQAGIRQSLVGGEMIEQAMGTALNQAGKAYTMASDRYADHVGVQAKKKANLVRADAEVSNLDASIEALQKRIDAGIKDPDLKLQYVQEMNKLKSRQAMWQSVIDSYDKEELANIMKSQNRRDVELAKAKAGEAEKEVKESVIETAMSSMGDGRKETDFIRTTNFEEIEEEPAEETPMALPTEQLLSMPGALQTAMSGLTAPTQELGGLGIRSMPSPMDVINPINPGFFRTRKLAEYPETKKRTKLNETAFYDRE